MTGPMMSGRRWLAAALLLLAASTGTLRAQQKLASPVAACGSTVTARVVALDAAIFANRMGAQLPDAMIFALAEDVEPTDKADPADWTTWTAGNVGLKAYKRARPLVLRVNKGQCLNVQFRNLVSASTSTASVPPYPGCAVGEGGQCCPNPTVPPTSATPPCQTSQPNTRAASLHVQGLEWRSGPGDDGSHVGRNASSLANPGDPVLTYQLYAPEEGPFLLYSTGDVFSANAGPPGAGSPNGGDGGQLQQGLFGALIVEPKDAEHYRSQVTFEDLCLATKGSTWAKGVCAPPANGSHQIDYQKVYPAGHPRAGQPILRMARKTPGGFEAVHSDLTAVITGPNAGRFKDATAPGFHDVGVSPDRLEPFREFTIIYHEMFRTQQAFWPLYNDNQLKNGMESANDNFAINYGMGGIGSEILANRFSRGPAANCLDCKYEEFFLSSWTNGDPAMVVDVPADTGCALPSGSTDYTQFACPPGAPKATQAFYPDDPSNVYHGYLWDHTKFRILHGGSDLHHVHHLHAHQWLHSPDSSSGHYLDSQAIGPGAAFTLEMVYNGSGNKNLTVGDSIFHCHFYPHFAAGMWALWRVHDVLEAGTELASYPKGQPKPNARALPDGEIALGTPIPAVVPVPTRPLAPAPAPVRLVQEPGILGTQVEVCTTAGTDCISSLTATGDPKKYKNPGYPFFIPGMAGTRSVHPPLDFALACSGSGEPCDKIGSKCGGTAGSGGTCQALDGGLPRHLVQSAVQANKYAGASPYNVMTPAVNPLDFSKEVVTANGIGLPEGGTVIERVAMAYHGVRKHPSVTPEGTAENFITNGHSARPGAPYADPCIDIDGNLPKGMRNIDYWGVDFQTDAVFNKEGWHYPQQRMISLWGDLFDYLGLKGGQKKAPEPFFIRANSNDCVHYRLANLIPKTYELDDFQVRTPTDILGQHIHLVKFDVTSSDGGANGFNYEDGTLAPDEIVERINAFNNGNWFPTFGAAAATKPALAPSFIKYFGADPTCAQNPGSAACQCKVVEDPHNPGHYGTSGGRWCGAQATYQLWYVDPTLNDAGDDMTLRTVFTHDHFGPSTHQQAGVYAALVAEPAGSTWHDNETGTPLGGRTAAQNGVSLKDGGPTSWQAVIKTAPQAGSFREFVLALQDSTLMYRPFPAYLTPACPAGQVCGFCSNDHAQACSTDIASKIYWEDVCKAVALPNPGGNASTLQPSCNYVAGTPANASLFSSLTYTNPKNGKVSLGNVFGVTSGTQWDALQTIGWGDQSSTALPIDPGPKGLFGAGQSTQTKQPQPEIIILDGATTNFSFSYRNEPLYPRLWSNGVANAGDTSSVYRSAPRNLPGEQPSPYAPLTPGLSKGDPYTPLLRANAGDDVQIRLVVGAHQNPHNFTVHGVKWLFEPSNVNSGWRSTQTMGISEHFELLFKVPGQIQEPGAQGPVPAAADYLYKATAAKQGQMSGNWGILRAYNTKQPDLFPLPGATTPAPAGVCPAALMTAKCGATDGKGHTLRCYDVVAFVASSLFGANGVVYNSKLGWNSPSALLYVLADDYAALAAKKAVPGIDPATGLAEPLVLRAGAGDCIKVTLANRIPKGATLGQGFASGQLPVDGAAGQPANNRGLFVPSTTSPEVGLHPQLLAYDVTHSDGYNVGDNPAQTVAPQSGDTPATRTYWWYAGTIDPQKGHIPVELGAVNLMPADPLNHHPYSLFAALVVEPEKATWQTDPNSRASATVTAGNTSFREQVLIVQDDGVIFTADGVTPNVTRQAGGGFGGFNLRTEPLNGDPARTCKDGLQACLFSNAAICQTNPGTCGFSLDIPIETPTFCARAGQQARIRLLHPGGAVTNNVFELFGHTFAEEPYVTAKANCAAPMTHTNPLASQVMRVGNECPDGNVALGPSLTEWKGSRSGHGPANHFDLVIEKAGGRNAVAGDYLYRSFPAPHLGSGIWGIFRVTAGDPTPALCPSFQTPGASSSAAAAGAGQ